MNTNPNEYDLVIVGTPVWNAFVSAPVRTFLHANRDRIRHVAFFCTQGGRGSARAFRQMETVCGQNPVATLVVGSGAVRRADLATRVQAFASALKSISLGERPATVGSLRSLPA
jgi:multimeric flavodoxin WrbA